MDRVDQCALFVKSWYLDGFVVTVEMTDRNHSDEAFMQAIVVEMLKDFINNPPPEGLLEGSAQLNSWIDFSMRKVMDGLDFGFSEEQEGAIKNLAFNYWITGASNVRSDPKLRERVFKCIRPQVRQ